MSVQIEFVSVVVKKSAIKQKYGPGIKSFISNFGPFDGPVTDSDSHLLKDGAMSSSSAQAICRSFERAGLQGLSEDGQAWVDFCVIDELAGPTRSCDWIIYDSKTRTARHRDDTVASQSDL